MTEAPKFEFPEIRLLNLFDFAIEFCTGSTQQIRHFGTGVQNAHRRPFPDNDLQRTLTGQMAPATMKFFLQSEVPYGGRTTRR
jgi:hypothetical protein